MMRAPTGRIALAVLAAGLGLGATGRAGTPALALAAALFAETNWPACRLECRRYLLEAPGDPEARFLQALAEQRMGGEVRPDLWALAGDSAAPAELALAARYEWARAAWSAGDRTGAFEAFRGVFEQSDRTDLSIRAGCALGLLMAERPALARKHSGIAAQVRTLRPLYTRDLVAECRPPHPDPAADAWTGRPGQWFIALYRSQIRPALGERCSLYPNCSEYARQAFARHGVLGVALAADRFFREPGVAASGPPVEVNGRILRADLLDDHDGWLD